MRVECVFALFATCDEVKEEGDDSEESLICVDFPRFHVFESFYFLDFNVLGSHVFDHFVDVVLWQSHHFHPIEKYHKDIICLSFWMIHFILE